MSNLEQREDIHLTSHLKVKRREGSAKIRVAKDPLMIDMVAAMDETPDENGINQWSSPDEFPENLKK
jgi:hypothetical protein